MPTSLQLVSDQFPHVRERVACLFERNDLFRELCEDYRTCAEALAGQPAGEGLQRELSALQLRLETELLRYLNEDADPPVQRR
jgi:hypothetical protein